VCFSLVHFEWADNALIVDFSGDMTAKDFAAIHEGYSSASPAASHWKRLPFHVVSSYDRQRGFAPSFGLSRPERVTLKMVQACARQTHDALQRWMSTGEQTSDGALYQLFHCSAIETKYNVVIHFNKSIVNKPVVAGSSVGQNKWLSVLSGPPAFHTTLFSNLSGRELSGADLCYRYRLFSVYRQLIIHYNCNHDFFYGIERNRFKLSMWNSLEKSTAAMRYSSGTRHQVCIFVRHFRFSSHSGIILGI
jgi:hypothetical protein